jgi:hypothetical protein
MLERLTGKRVSGVVSAGLATVALAACGTKETSSVTSKIPPCPAFFTFGERPLKDVPAAQQALQQGVAELRTRLGANVNNEVPIESIKSTYLGAVDAVFNQDSSNGPDFAEVGSATKVDGTGQAFCYGEKPYQVYYSPATEAAIGGLATVDIHVVSTSRH